MKYIGYAITIAAFAFTTATQSFATDYKGDDHKDYKKDWKVSYEKKYDKHKSFDDRNFKHEDKKHEDEKRKHEEVKVKEYREKKSDDRHDDYKRYDDYHYKTLEHKYRSNCEMYSKNYSDKVVKYHENGSHWVWGEDHERYGGLVVLRGDHDGDYRQFYCEDDDKVILTEWKYKGDRKECDGGWNYVDRADHKYGDYLKDDGHYCVQTRYDDYSYGHYKGQKW